MNRIVKLSMCFLLMLGVSSIQEVSAEEPTTYTGDAEEGDNTDKNQTVNAQESTGFVANKSDVIVENIAQDNLSSFRIRLSTPNNIELDTRDYYLNVISSDDSFFSKESVNGFTFSDHFKGCGYITSFIDTTELRPLKEGNATLEIELINKENPNDKYYAKRNIIVTDKYKGMKLVSTKNEFTTFTDGLLVYHVNGTGIKEILNAKKDEFQLGLMDDDGNINYVNEIEATSSDSSIAVGGYTELTIKEHWQDDAIEKPDISAYYPEYIKTFNLPSEHDEAVWEYLSSVNLCGGYGGAGDGNDVYSIIPRNTGTAYVTFSYGTQSVTVKVNVTNLTDEPSETLPSDLSKEFFSDANEKINVNLSKADTVSSDIFTSALESGKEVTFNILGENNRTQYAWTFNGATITNPDIDLNLSLVFTSDLKDKIENLVTDKNILYLTFAHHGELPGIAKMKVDVSSQYKDGDEIYLYYYNEETGKAEQTGDKVIVKDGYAEFEISHCSTYYFTSELNENTEKVEPTTPSTDNNVKSDVTSDVKANAEVKKDNNAIKDTGLDTVATTQGIAISMLIFALLGLAVIEKRKHSQVN